LKREEEKTAKKLKELEMIEIKKVQKNGDNLREAD